MCLVNRLGGTYNTKVESWNKMHTKEVKCSWWRSIKEYFGKGSSRNNTYNLFYHWSCGPRRENITSEFRDTQLRQIGFYKAKFSHIKAKIKSLMPIFVKDLDVTSPDSYINMHGIHPPNWSQVLWHTTLDKFLNRCWSISNPTLH